MKFNYFCCVFFMFFIFSCGNKKSASGGPEDLEKPKLLYSVPEQYEMLSNKMEFNFSKPIDKTSVVQNIYIYPPLEREVKVKSNNIYLEILDSLLVDRTYYITFSKKIKGHHGNELDKYYTLLYHTGKLADINSELFFYFPEEENSKKEIKYTIMDEDSLVVFSQITVDNNVVLPYLFDSCYNIKAYMDKNKNNKYDIEVEPYIFTNFKPEKDRSFSFNMAYADTTLPKIKNITMPDKSKVNVSFSERVLSNNSFQITNSDSLPVPILASEFIEDKLNIIIEPQDSLDLNFVCYNLSDYSKNINSRVYKQFTPGSIADTLAPRVVYTEPRNGGVIASFQPTLKVGMSEIIMNEDISFTLISQEDGKIVPVSLESYNSSTLSFVVEEKLRNYSSYKLIIDDETKDVNHNKMREKFSFIFLIVK